ncbi:MAG: hypothetical protein C0412_05760 [Flavobacterium sp.]|nr:hypothetical protein [Flavobacterium sp.]
MNMNKKTIIIIILGIFNIVLLTKILKNNTEKFINNNNKFTVNKMSVDRLIRIVSLEYKSIMSEKIIKYSSEKTPAVIFIFSLKDCQTCIYRMFQGLSKIINTCKAINIIAICIDAKERGEELLKYLVNNKVKNVNVLSKLVFNTSYSISTPQVLCIDKNGYILNTYSASPLPSEDEELLWLRIKQMYVN